jgi:superfamily II DNA/RNA helicase
MRPSLHPSIQPPPPAPPAAEEKQLALAEFKSGLRPVLVSTTVVEVGVDVPTASLMVVEHAGRFGLAQLHQLRGRVGRGRRASTCVLVVDSAAEQSKLKVGVVWWRVGRAGRHCRPHTACARPPACRAAVL